MISLIIIVVVIWTYDYKMTTTVQLHKHSPCLTYPQKPETCAMNSELFQFIT